jgi:hypothetical protein
MLVPSLDLGSLFRDPGMFDGNRDWRKAGFDVEGEGALSDIMVASHPSAPGVLFKKYGRKISLKDQRKNYRRRIDGAAAVRELVTNERLTRIAVPCKELYELPRDFARKGEPAYVLVVEHMHLLKSSDSKQMYRQIDDDTLKQLCTVLLAFRGLDSGVRNVPFTTSGQIAFIDTERWNDKRDGYLRRIREYLSSSQMKFAESLR